MMPLSASAAFQRLAFSLPLTRNVARRRAGRLFDLATGFVQAQVLAACVELDLFRWMAEGPRSAAELAARSGLTAGAAERLLDAAAALDLLKRRRGGLYAPGVVGAPLSGKGGEGVAAMIAHHHALYEDLRDPVAFLTAARTTPGGSAAGGTGSGDARGRLARFWPYAGAAEPQALGGEAVGPYSALMAASQDFVADDVLDALRYRGTGPWLDLGGGSGAFLARAAGRSPKLTGTVVDLPAVAALASARFAEAGLAHRLDAIGGEIARLALPARYPVVSLVRVLHDHDDDDAMEILKAARRALAPGGRLVIAEPLRGRRADARVSDAYFGIYLLAMGQGRLRTPAELGRLAAAAGFSPLREHRTRRPFLTRLLTTQ